MYVVDASVWVASLLTADAHHKASSEWVRQRSISLQPIVIPATALPEVAGAISRRTGDADAANRMTKSMQQLPNVRLVSVDPALSASAAALAATLRLRGADAVYVAVASLAGMKLVTWDEEQRQRGSSAIPAVTPAMDMAGS